MVLLLVSSVFLFIYALLILYYYRGWRKAATFQSFSTAPRVFISVIVPARNEEKNISALLNALANQSFNSNFFEVIVVDDFSDDDTGNVVRSHPASNTRLISPDLDASLSSKKKAIETGISQAKGELIVTTDADCIPPVEWLQTIHDYYVTTDALFIAAPVKFTHESNTVQIFQALDFLVLQGITAASVSTGFHTMCNGANLAYRKSAFHLVNGFSGIDRVATGDDMLLMHKIKKLNPSKIFYLKSQNAIVKTEPMPTWTAFFMQRKRWASKTLVYDDYRIIAILGFVYLLNCLFPVLIIASFLNKAYCWYVLSFWVLKTLIELPFVNSIAKFYKEQSLLKYFFFFQPLHMLYTVSVGLLSQFGKYEWKGRKTK